MERNFIIWSSRNRENVFGKSMCDLSRRNIFFGFFIGFDE